MMQDNGSKPTTIDEYIATWSPEVQAKLSTMRATIRAVAPDATEAIVYAVPTFLLANNNLVHFGAAKRHIALYPTSSGVEMFKDELVGYSVSKGTIRFPLDEPLPLDLITRIVTFRVAENLALASDREAKQRGGTVSR